MQTIPLVRVHGVDDVRIDRVAPPRAGANDAVIRVAACGICGSDLGYIALGGIAPAGVAMPLGHELSGTIESLGDKVRHLHIGQRVTVNPMANGHAIGNGGSEGGFSPLLLVKDAALHHEAVLPLPDTINFELGALIEPLAVAMHGVHRAQLQAGQSVAVLGAGPIGLCTVVVLKHYGIDNIVIADQSAQRLAIARQLGAAALCNVVSEELADCLQREHGTATTMLGATLPATDVYIEATGVGSVLEQALSLAQTGATIVVLGVHKEAIQLHPLELLAKELRLIGAMAYPQEFPQVIAMLANGDIDLTPLITHRFALDEFHAALATAHNRELAGKVLITVPAQ